MRLAWPETRLPTQHHQNPRGVGAIDASGRFGVFKFRVKLPSSLPREVHDIPDGSQFVYHALFDILSQPRMAGIGMTDRAVIVPRKNGYRRILIPVFVF